MCGLVRFSKQKITFYILCEIIINKLYDVGFDYLMAMTVVVNTSKIMLALEC